MTAKVRFLDWEIYRIGSVDEYQYFEWAPGQEPEFIEGVIFTVVPPAGESITIEASIKDAQEPASDREYGNIGTVGDRSKIRDSVVDTPFRHFRLRGSVYGGSVAVYTNGRLQRVDPTKVGA